MKIKSITIFAVWIFALLLIPMVSADLNYTTLNSVFSNFLVHYNSEGFFRNISNTIIGNINGTIDDVMIFNTSLTSAQILAIYNNQSARFLATGTQDIINQTYMNISTGNNRVNVTTYTESLLGSSINLTVGYYDDSLSWSYTTPQVVSSGAVQTFTITSTSTNLTLNYTFYAGNSTNPFYSPIIQYNITFDVWNEAGAGDTIYPIFSGYWDDNASLIGSGTGHFNVTVANTNGTVYLRINGTTIYATNLSASNYNVSFAFGSAGTYQYNWTAYGNGTSHNLNTSANRYYTVNTSLQTYSRNITQTFITTSSINRIGSLKKNTLQSLISSFLTSKVTSLNRGISQLFTGNFITSRLYSGTRKISQSFTSLFSINKFITFPKSINQLFTPTFTINRAYSGIRKTIFNPSLSFLTNRIYSATRSISQAFTSNFLVNRVYGGIRNTYQSFISLFSVSKFTTFPKLIYQSFSNNFFVSRTYISMRNTIFTPSFNFIINRVSSLSRTVYQSFTSLFSVTTIKTTLGQYLRNITQLFTGLFNVNKTYSGTRNTIFAPSFNFIINRVYSGTRSISQPFLNLFSIIKIRLVPTSISQLFTPTFIVNRVYKSIRNIIFTPSLNFITTRIGNFGRNIFQRINMLIDSLKEIMGITEVPPSNPPSTSSVTYLNITNKTKEMDITKEINKTIIKKIEETIKSIDSRVLLIIGILFFVIFILSVLIAVLMKKNKRRFDIFGVMFLLSLSLAVSGIFLIKSYKLSLFLISISAIMLIIIISVLIDKNRKV